MQSSDDEDKCSEDQRPALEAETERVGDVVTQCRAQGVRDQNRHPVENFVGSIRHPIDYNSARRDSPNDQDDDHQRQQTERRLYIADFQRAVDIV